MIIEQYTIKSKQFTGENEKKVKKSRFLWKTAIGGLTKWA